MTWLKMLLSIAYQNLLRPGVTSCTISQSDEFKIVVNRDVRGQFNFKYFIVNHMKASHTKSKYEIQNTLTFQKVEVIN
jgi:hypothetical protein